LSSDKIRFGSFSGRSLVIPLFGGSTDMLDNAAGSSYPVSGFTAKNVQANYSPINATMKNFYVALGANPGVGKSWLFRIWANGFDTHINITIAGAAQSFGSDLIHSSPIDDGGFFAVGVIPTNTPASCIAEWGLLLQI
jgi:hypothetical protein